MSQSANRAAPQPLAHLLTLATDFLRAGRPGDAIAPLRDAALLQPSNPAIQHDLGLACLEIGRLPDAIAALKCAIANNPRYADAHFRLGIALEKLGNIREAIVAYDVATRLDPLTIPFRVFEAVVGSKKLPARSRTDGTEIFPVSTP
jgi:Flp pilus assembly protein TadD